MERLADRLDKIRVTARAPGTEIEAELRSGADIRLTFGESVYEFSTEQALERSLANLARQLYAGWQRQYLAAIADTALNVHPVDLHDRNFVEEREQVEAVGESGDGKFRISSIGMQNFSVQIASGTVREVNEHEFGARVSEAARSMVEDFQDKVRELQLRYYG